MKDTLLIDGRLLAEKIRLEARKKIVDEGLTPQLAVILVGDDPASKLYVSLKEKACQQVGIDFHKYLIAADAKKEHLLETIQFLNNDENIDAILIQLPLPDKFNEDEAIGTLDPAKDVDGFHPVNIKKFLAGEPGITPGLAMGILRLIQETGEPIDGKRAVIVANSEIFTKPLIKLLTDKGVTATYIPADNKHLSAETRLADILVVAAGRPGLINGDMIKQDSIIIDVGTNKVGNETIGDVDLDSINGIADFITPVPGGVGPVTVAMLLQNAVYLAEKKSFLKK